MTRFIQQDHSDPKPKKAKKEEPRVLPKPGEYSAYELSRAKKIISPEGGKR